MTEQTRFWMVYGIGQRQPTYQHQSEHSATMEAKRLALHVPGCTFVVLTVVSAFKVETPVQSLKIVDPDPIPF